MKIDHYAAPGPIEAVAGEARLARDVGFDGMWTAETAHDPLLGLVAAAHEAPVLELGTAITVAFARSPMTLAYSAWDLADHTSGRFTLGLGSQVRAHVVGRFGMPWLAPVSQMREYIAALRAIWRSWQEGEPLRFKGEHYRFSLMTPFFDPGPIEHPDIPIYLAAVGGAMCRLVGEVADGIHAHPFHTPGYLQEVVVPAIAEGAQRSGRDPGSVVLSSAILVATGRDDVELQSAVEDVRRQIAFYASTPTYRTVLDFEGWGMGEELSAHARRGEWQEMAGLVTDEMLEAVAVIAPVADLGDALRERAEGHLDRIGLYLPEGASLDGDDLGAVVSAVR